MQLKDVGVGKDFALGGRRYRVTWQRPRFKCALVRPVIGQGWTGPEQDMDDDVEVTLWTSGADESEQQQSSSAIYEINLGDGQG